MPLYRIRLILVFAVLTLQLAALARAQADPPPTPPSPGAATNDLLFDRSPRTSALVVGSGKDPMPKLSCADFGRFAVVQTDDPHSKGAQDITVRYRDPDPRPPRPRPENLCELRHPFKGKARSLKIGEVYYWGTWGDLIFVHAAETPNHYEHFDIFSATDGHRVYSADRYLLREITLLNNGAQRVMIFNRKLEAKCPLEKDSPQCWKEILEQNHIPPLVNLKKPECEAWNSKETANARIDAAVSAPVKITMSADPKLEYLPGKGTCDPALP